VNLSARVLGVGVHGPGLEGWDRTRAMLSGGGFLRRPTAIPTPDALPATERRRAGRSVKLALAAGLEACAHAGLAPAATGAVFTSSSGDGENCHAICEVLASEERAISPTRFHNSVHNAPSGYWSIATGATAACDCVAAYDASFAAGLVEALTRLAAEPRLPLVLVSYDVPYPSPLNEVRPIADAFALALVLASPGTPGAHGPKVSLTLGNGTPQRMADPALEELRCSIPAARALPLLDFIARGERCTVILEYLDGVTARVEVEP